MEPLNDWFTHNPEFVLHSIYSDNLPWMENFVQQNSGFVSDAQDLFQEAVTAAWINLHTGHFTGTREQFNAYLRQIARYKWLNMLRSRSRSKTRLTDQVPEPDPLTQQDPPALENETNFSLLQDCFKQLGEKCRNILGLFYYQKKSLHEIAHSLNSTENSIKTIKYRCMMQLRQLFLEKSKSNGSV